MQFFGFAFKAFALEQKFKFNSLGFRRGLWEPRYDWFGERGTCLIDLQFHEWFVARMGLGSWGSTRAECAQTAVLTISSKNRFTMIAGGGPMLLLAGAKP